MKNMINLWKTLSWIGTGTRMWWIKSTNVYLS